MRPFYTMFIGAQFLSVIGFLFYVLTLVKCTRLLREILFATLSTGINVFILMYYRCLLSLNGLLGKNLNLAITRYYFIEHKKYVKHTKINFWKDKD